MAMPDSFLFRPGRPRVLRAVAALALLAGSPVPRVLQTACAQNSTTEAVAGPRYSPVDLEVIDVEATVALALKSGEALPLVAEVDSSVADDVAGAFTRAYEETRDAFLTAMERRLGMRVVAPASAAEPRFRDFRSEFQAANLQFPVSLELGQTWAIGSDGAPERERILSALRAVQRDSWIGELRPASTVFIVNAGSAVEARSWGAVAGRTRTLEPAQVLDLEAAGAKLRRLLDPADRTAAGFLTRLLRANVAEDTYLTGLLLQDRMGSRAVHRWIARGELLTQPGKPEDRWTTLARLALQRQGLAPAEEPPVVAEKPETATAGAADSLDPERFVWVWWTAGGILGVAAIALGGMAVVVVRRRRNGFIDTVPAGASHDGRGGALIPHLARELKDRLVRALFTQRSVLLANEQAASRRVQEMEERLARLQPAIADKIRGYEQRIESLEKEIAERDVETRELIRAKLVLARKDLEAEIARNRIEWN